MAKFDDFFVYFLGGGGKGGGGGGKGGGGGGLGKSFKKPKRSNSNQLQKNKRIQVSVSKVGRRSKCSSCKKSKKKRRKSKKRCKGKICYLVRKSKICKYFDFQKNDNNLYAIFFLFIPFEDSTFYCFNR